MENSLNELTLDEGADKTSWHAFLNVEFPKAYAEVTRLSSIEDPETEPFRSKYAALKLLAECKQKARAYMEGNDAEGVFGKEQQVEARDFIAMLDYKSGSISLETEDPTQAESDLSAAVKQLESDEAQNASTLQDALNLLGVIWSNRGEHAKAEGMLKRAETIYLRYSSDGSETARHASKMESQYTMTALYLAQVYAGMGDDVQGTAYAGLTLSRQLAHRQEFDPVDWAQNCAQLSGHYVVDGDYATALHCLSAAHAVLGWRDDTQRQVSRDVEANVQIGFGRVRLNILKLSSDEELARHKLLEDNAISADELTAQGQSNPSTSNQVVTSSAATISHGERDASSGGQSSEAAPGDSVAEATDERDGECGETERRRGLSGIPAGPLRFQVLDLPEPDLGEGCSEEGLVKGYAGAVTQFNAGMAAFKTALEFYVLDGYVTEHFNILMDISAIHKHLAVFEKDHHRAALIHKRRATRLEALVEILNPQAYPVQWRKLLFELGDIYREAMECELLSHKGHAKVAPLAKQASIFYEHFRSTFGSNKVPEEHHFQFLMALFYLARVYGKLHPPAHLNASRGVKFLKLSLDHYQAVLDHAATMKAQGLIEQLDICREMVQLLPPRMDAELAEMQRRS